MADRKISFTAARKALRAVALQYPARAQRRACRYYEAGSSGRVLTSCPSCIVGHVFALLGIGPEHFSPETNARRLKSLPSLCALLDDRAVRFLQYAQDYQDDGNNWLSAYRQAVRLDTSFRTQEWRLP